MKSTRLPVNLIIRQIKMENKFKKTNLHQQLVEEFNDDPQFKAEGALLDLTECICEINKRQQLPIRMLIRIIEWCTHKAIYWR